MRHRATLSTTDENNQGIRQRQTGNKTTTEHKRKLTFKVKQEATKKQNIKTKRQRENRRQQKGKADGGKH